MPTPTPPGKVPESAAAMMERVVLRKMLWRIVPLLSLGYFLSFVDRVNVGFAALEMNQAVGLTPAQFGVGAGIFFVSYVLCEIPSNMMQVRVGARIWIARIMISWGIASAMMVFVQGPLSFYAVRLLLGAAEAGFFPGVVLYLTYFFPAAERARIVAIFALAVPLSSLAGSPVSALLLELHGIGGLDGWQWLFLMEALPAVILGIVLIFTLPDEPRTAKWLTPAEKSWVIDRLASETQQSRVAHASVWKIMTNPFVLVLSLALGGGAGVSSALSLWQPQMIKSFGLTNLQVGMLNSVPFALGCVAMVVWGMLSDRRNERLWHTVMPLALSALGLIAAMFVHGVIPFVAVLCVVMIGTYAFKGPFWGLSTEWLAGPAVVVGLAQVNSAGNVFTFLTSTSIGLIRGATGSFSLALLPLVAVTVIGCVGLVIVGRSDIGTRSRARAAAALAAGGTQWENRN